MLLLPLSPSVRCRCVPQIFFFVILLQFQYLLCLVLPCPQLLSLGLSVFFSGYISVILNLFLSSSLSYSPFPCISQPSVIYNFFLSLYPFLRLLLVRDQFVRPSFSCTFSCSRRLLSSLPVYSQPHPMSLSGQGVNLQI